jgi:hypothetical protein
MAGRRPPCRENHSLTVKVVEGHTLDASLRGSEAGR